jgi:N6-L-threonylcarbamoyladenine synthase
MRIISIETSCDDTCIAVIESFGKKKPRFRVLSNIVSSQIEIHKKWGGVYPAMAKREHQKNLVIVLKEALSKAKLLKGGKNTLDIERIATLKKILEREERLFKSLVNFLSSYEKSAIDAIAVTTGPGLEPCLWSGINLAKSLSFWWKIPIIPVNHIEAHIFANFFGSNSKSFPAICLVVSGGHTQLILMKKIGSYKILGETRDDAAGEGFDKIARILGLGYPGGPIIAAKAEKFKNPNLKFQIRPVKSAEGGAKQFNRVKLPRPMLNQKNYDFSFSGLKTAVLYDFKNRAAKIRRSKFYIQEMCFETQQAIIDVLLDKTKKAAKDLKVKAVILGGGVTANKELRKQFKKCFSKERIKLLIPEVNFSTDNASMVGVAAYFNRKKIRGWKEIVANANQCICDKSYARSST